MTTAGTVSADSVSSTHRRGEPGRANAAWAICAAITHNLLRAAGSLASRFHTRARGATLRRHLITVPARLARPQGQPILHLPAHWPWHNAWHGLHTAATGPPRTA